MLAAAASLALALSGPGPAAPPPAVTVTAEGTCPSTAAIEARLRPMLPHGGSGTGTGNGAGTERARARIEPIDDLVRIEVRGADGALLTVHDLTRGAPCADLAAAAAVIIATALSTAAPAAPLPPPPQVMPPPPPPPPGAVAPPPPPRPAVRWDVGLSFLGAFAPATGTGAAPATWGGSLEAQLAPRRGPFGLRVALVGTAGRRQGLGDGSAEWSRLSGWLGARYRLEPRGGRVLIDLHAALVMGRVALAGTGFPQDLRSQGLDVGAGAGVRVGVPWRLLLPHVQLTACGFARPHDLRVAGEPDTGARVPALDVQLGVGLSVGRWSL